MQVAILHASWPAGAGNNQLYIKVIQMTIEAFGVCFRDDTFLLISVLVNLIITML